MPSPFPCRPVIREWLSKKTQIEKKKWNFTAGPYRHKYRNTCIRHRHKIKHRISKPEIPMREKESHKLSFQSIILPNRFNLLTCNSSDQADSLQKDDPFKQWVFSRGVSRTAATSKMECLVIIVDVFQLLSQSAPSWTLQQS